MGYLDPHLLVPFAVDRINVTVTVMAGSTVMDGQSPAFFPQSDRENPHLIVEMPGQQQKVRMGSA